MNKFIESGLQKAIRLAGGTQTALARMLKLTPQAIQAWVKNGKPSKDGCIKIEAVFRGRITRAELDPATFAPRQYGQIACA